VNETSTASAMVLLAKVLIPSHNKRFTMLLNQIVKFAEFGATKAAGFSERDWREPKLGIPLGLLHVNMMRLYTLTAEEEKPIPWMRRTSGMEISYQARALRQDC